MVEKQSACSITFPEKVQIYSHDFLKACVYIAGFDKSDNPFTKKLYSRMTATSHLLEDFLDLHGAKNNRDWFYYRELTSLVRHISISCYAQRHIANRIPFYDLPDASDFEGEGRKTLEFLNDILRKAAPALLSEARRLGIRVPEGGYDQANFPGVVSGEMLEYNIDDDAGHDQRKHIVKISSEFLNIAKLFAPLTFYEAQSLEAIREMVPAKVNEVEIRGFEMVVHNLQSSFDSYVIQGGFRYGNRKLKQLRAHFSVVLHIMEVQGRLLHFYERHLHEVGTISTYREVRRRLGEIVNPDELLDRTINYCLFYACHFMSCGKRLAKEVLNENIERGSITVGIPETRGFHARPSLMVAKIVQNYGGEVELVVNGDRFDASSVLDIQWAGGKIQKEEVKQVIFEGDTRALSDIELLASVNYAEDSMGKGLALPKGLKYLK
ncbi:HPr family phosphocarrier protein [Desulfoluna sp.]|uniref:HPr family phosphocarrier protein n=1 Tax=Desulfoluna sp. TaxID=2045199 RepID=UPI00263732F2|nr:HPr family phosphocarrier protein [Desulfoluna sp.]